ncbi:acyl carrier protein [Methanococcoides methylutens]|uniref:Acyl carrier protein n=1 Tax=Methanococcoides methylutens TaxID=2226 RepID=A0A099T0V8_METMT|nr:acyl carrier protein [Methanococcoides methylutens]KGK97738.1 acyl carrier protein [Methanococcoides methylutens]
MDEIKEDIMTYLQNKSFMDSSTQLNDDDSLTMKGIIDSIGLIEFIDFISDKYSIEIPEDLLTPDNFDSINGIVKLVQKLTK